MRATYNHPLWHYIEIPYQADGQPLPPEQKPRGAPPYNIIEALGKCTADLKDPKVSR